MSTKHKQTKGQQAAKDREDNRKFLIVLAISTALLMLLMYFLLS